MTYLVQCLDLGRLSAAFGNDQGPDRLDVPVTRLGLPERSAGLSSTRCFDRIQGVGLALTAAELTVRSVDLDHLHTTSSQ